MFESVKNTALNVASKVAEKASELSDTVQEKAGNLVENMPSVSITSGRDTTITNETITVRKAASLNVLSKLCHDASVAGGWWHDLDTGERKERNKGELMMLIVSEMAEAFEGERKNKKDDHLPHRPSAEVELADTLIRIFDYAGAHGYDLDGAFYEKLEYNANRADHKPENRRKADGKKF